MWHRLSADSWLTVVASSETVRAAEAGVRRSQVFEQMTAAVVKAELRPGADLSRARAELAAARTQLALARQGEAVARPRSRRWLALRRTRACDAVQRTPADNVLAEAAGRRSRFCSSRLQR